MTDQELADAFRARFSWKARNPRMFAGVLGEDLVVLLEENPPWTPVNGETVWWDFGHDGDPYEVKVVGLIPDSVDSWAVLCGDELRWVKRGELSRRVG